jgi:hypothetical protein
MLTRCNDAVRRALSLADQEAVRFHHDYIGTEHLLLALVRLPCVAVRVLTRLGIAPADVRRAVEACIRIDHDRTPENRPLTPRAREVLSHAVAAAERQGEARAGTGHLLLGLLQGSDSVAHQVLGGLGPLTTSQGVAQVADLVGAEVRAGPDTEGPEEPVPELSPDVLRALETPGPPIARTDGGPLAAEVRVPLPQAQVRRHLDAEDQAGALLLGAARGALRGLAWSLLVALVLLCLLWRPPAQGGPERALSIAGLTVFVWVFVSAVGGALRAREQMLPDDYDALVGKHTRQMVFRTTLVLAPLALFLLGTIWDRSPPAAVMLSAMVLGVGLVAATMVGFAKGTKAAQLLHERDGQAALAFVASHEPGKTLARWDANTLAQRRRALQHAIEARFGPLDEGAREQIQAWDQDRLLEAGDHLAEAHSVGELEVERKAARPHVPPSPPSGP